MTTGNLPIGAIAGNPDYSVSRRYAWMAFAVVFLLMLSDYLSRQVINAIFPFLKSSWSLSDAQLGSLVSVVALTIGVLSIPISILVDRFGRVKSVTVMAIGWALATIACGMVDSFAGMLVARALVGVGEAAYGSAGAAILTRIFPARLHATVMGSFLAAGMIGSVLGVVLGGVIAQSLGWRMAFFAMGGFGLFIAVLFPFIVKEPAPVATDSAAKIPVGKVLANLLKTPTLVLVAVAGGCTMFVQTSYVAWLPSFLNRYYDLPADKASLGTGILIIFISMGMVIGGNVVDRASVANPVNRLRMMMAYGLVMGTSLLLGLSLAPGWGQLALMAIGLFFSTSFLGAALAVAADVTPARSHATTFAVLALAYMLIGGAPGPLVTGKIADMVGLKTALSIIPIGALLGALCFYFGSKTYLRDRMKCKTPDTAKLVDVLPT